ncbi:YifB family Mg chelatase-like AAA ATPase [Nocardioides nitrophenolicus]|uniref:YifB family Mg chelatase-like AAA ATPase n=1 Tax=Nocardioides nitrophenolicus TaxID=60489 RepID=UPI0019583C05|nr:YifB family Mg chelatase-like AAA ATPase [Nocardioides nitrophenolicus]MBM7519580.1 magnesium chelatase family protein [Nocardioides nitrophenolicus]
MPFATARCVALAGAVGHLIDVQTDVSVGQSTTVVVGRADTSLREGVDRVRMALINTDLRWPATKRCTFLFSPADLRKSGTHFDLAMAVSLLAADGQLEPGWLDGTVFIGELTLSGGLRSALGVLPMVLAAAAAGIGRVYLPEPQLAEAMMVPGMEVIGVRSLAQVVAGLRGDELPLAPPVAAATGLRLLSWRGDERLDELDFRDLRGMAEEKYAVEVAAAGAHPLQLSGPKGCGKTSLAERIPTILPDLTPEESLELTALHSLAGSLDPEEGMLVRPPFAAPHHDASKVSVVGGGSGRVQPGAISRAHCGVLFLDEFPLFRADVVEALRQPLENGDITIARRDESVTLPASALLVVASNPCPCGNWSTAMRANRCTCAETVRRAYRAKLSGPIVDRIDILRHVQPAAPSNHDPFRTVETSAEVRLRVAAARQRQHDRYAGRPWRLNGQVPSPRLKDTWPLSPDAQRVVDAEMLTGRLSARGAVRVQRLAWTVADLRSVRTGRELAPGVDEVRTALRLRSGQSLDLAMFRPDGEVQPDPGSKEPGSEGAA